MKAFAVLATIILGITATATAQPGGKNGGAKILGSNAEGYRYMVGFMQNEIINARCPSLPLTIQISVASRFDCDVTVTFPDNTKLQFALKSYEMHSVDVPEQFECTLEGVSHNGIEVTATRPISVYCYSSRAMTSDGYLALPVNSWGNEYVSANYYLDQYDVDPNGSPTGNYCNLVPRGGEFAVIAAEDNTIVSVYPATTTLLNIPKGQAYTKILAKGDIFQVQDGGQTRGRSDLTGSVISANKPVGVLSGHVRAGVPFNMNSKDHLIEMLAPVNTHGKRHICVPFGGRQGGDLVRVIATTPGRTQLTITDVGGPFTTALGSVGQYFDIDLSRITVITSDKPVEVIQYARSAGADPRNAGSVVVNFDPDIVLITPEEQFVNAAVFQTLPNINPKNSAAQFDAHYVTVVAEDAKAGTMTLNGQPLNKANGYVSGLVAGTPFRWITVELPDNKLNVIQGEALFGGYVYGLGRFDSYAWPVGSGLRKLDVVDTQKPKLVVNPVCDGYQITVTDSGSTQTGIRIVRLDTAASTNTQLDKGLIIFGDEYSPATLKLIDRTKKGFGRVYVEDLAGNRDTLNLPIDIIGPSLTTIAPALIGATVKQSVTGAVAIRDTLALPVVVDSVRLASGLLFKLTGTYKNILIKPGDSLLVKFNFTAPSVKPPRYYDTLITVINCHEYRIPLQALVVAPEIGTHDLDFGKVRVGRNRTLSLHVTSVGLGVLELQDAKLTGAGFSQATPFTMPLTMAPVGKPNSDTVVNITFTPDRTGLFGGFVQFFSTADTVAIANIRGVGIYPELVVGGYDFGKVQIGDTGCTRVPIANTGSDTAYLTGLNLASPNFHIPQPSPFPYNLAPGDTLWVNVCFIPTEERGYTTPDLADNLDGLKAGNTITGAGYLLRASISGYDWRERWVGTRHDTVVYLRNRAANPVTVSKVWADAGDLTEFYIEPLGADVTVQPGDSVPVNVWFKPLQPGLRSCIIKALCDSRVQPVVDSLLQGFGLFALTGDKLDMDTTLAYSCGDRTGRVTIENKGNAPLTLGSFNYQFAPAPVTLTLDPAQVSPATKIMVGGQLPVDFTVDMAGYSGPVTGSFTWSFDELPGQQFTQSFLLNAAPQIHTINAAVPPRVASSGSFDLAVKVDSVRWKNLLEKEVELTLSYSPRITWFDLPVWGLRKFTDTSAWQAYGNPVIDNLTGKARLTFRPRSGLPAPLASAVFPLIPFRGFLGDRKNDTIRVTMAVPSSACAAPAPARTIYNLDSICGLSNRLFEYTGAPFAYDRITPNPVSAGKADIHFTVGMECETVLEVYGPDGKIVRTLMQRVLRPGQYTVTLDARDLPSGLYYCRLRSGPFDRTQHVLIVN